MNLLRSSFFLLLLLQSVVLNADEIEKVSLRPATDMQRADLFAWKPSQQPKAVLVLCPGCNGSGEGLIRQRVWQEFAKKHRLGLMGLSFASDVSLLTSGRGYYYASQGSGGLLLDGIRKIYGRETPLLLYGFSGGAHFTSRFVEWKPEQVIAWCAYSAGWWSPPSRDRDEPKQAKKNPPGIVACGDYDERYGASLIYFKQGRALGKPWLWISLPKIGHSVPQQLEEFVREYFTEILKFNGPLNPKKDGIWLDIDQKTEAEPDTVIQMPSVTAWLPDKKLLHGWTNIHEP